VIVLFGVKHRAASVEQWTSSEAVMTNKHKRGLVSLTGVTDTQLQFC